jgi:asparagine synthase (glutamine-hydrolysing)
VCNKLDGFFAFVLFDGENYIAARDPIGITTMYQGWAADGSIWFASEMKCLAAHCSKIITFPPGHFYSSKTGTHTRYYEPIWWNPDSFMPSSPVDYVRLRESLEAAVVKRLMADVPYGVLLSGGLDSSLIASIASRYMDRSAWGPVLHSFSIGLVGSPDVAAARTVAAFLKTKHHECYFTIQDGLDALSDVVYHLETYDVTTIRASTPMYLLSRKIKATGVKMVLSGEGSDEVFGGV